MTAPLVLPAKLDSAAAIQLARDLLAHQGADVALDASAVDLMGAKAMQTLVVAAASWQAAGHRLSVANLPDRARDQLALMGMTDLSLLEGAAP